MWRSALVSVLVALWCYRYLATQDDVIEKLTVKPNVSYDYVIGKQAVFLPALTSNGVQQTPETQ